MFYPSVSGLAIFKGNRALGLADNEVFGTLQTQPRHVGLMLNSDTPYAAMLLDLSGGPMVIELPPGSLICVAMDINQRWVADMGLPGPDAGQGGHHLLLPPGCDGHVPDGYHVGRSTANRVLGGIRSLPVGGDVAAATRRLTTVKAYPLDPGPGWKEPVFLDLTPQPQDTTPEQWENNVGFWQALDEIIQTEPPYSGYRTGYGELAALGIEKGKPFQPDDRMRAILERAAVMGSAHLRVESFADRRPNRVVWPDRRWEWAALRFENGDFDRPGSVDTEARDKWFFQAIGASPAMFRRDTHAGSLYWLGHRDADGSYLNGSSTYKLDIRETQGADSVDLYFGPTPPKGTKTAGSRPSPATDGSPPFASTAPNKPPSTAPGGPATSSPPRTALRRVAHHLADECRASPDGGQPVVIRPLSSLT